MEKNKIISILIAIFIIITIIGGIIIHPKDKENELNYFDVYDTSKVQDTTETIKTIKIHISGEVNYKGILELKEGSRIDDAIKQAGGITENADIDKINLAYELSDGQKLYIPNINEQEKKEYITEDSGIEMEEEKEEKININKATQTELETLPGIGPSLALKIIRYREENGKFNNIEELKNVKGVGENKYEEIKELIKVK